MIELDLLHKLTPLSQKESEDCLVKARASVFEK